MMTFAALRRFGVAILALGLLPTIAARPALAETVPAVRSWTDPPPREAAEANTEGKSQAKSETPQVPAVSKQAAAPTPSRPRAASRAPKAVAARPVPRRVTAVARHATPRRSVVAVLPRTRAPAIRTVTMRAAAPVPKTASRYGYVVEAAPDRSGIFVGGRMFEDDRASRIRQAREAGYLVVRSRTVEFPDGRRLRIDRPLDEEADD